MFEITEKRFIGLIESKIELELMKSNIHKGYEVTKINEVL